jgi:hypothetical protein
VRRRRRWFSILAVLPLLALVPVLNGCAMTTGNTPQTTPKTGPGTDYPCGVQGMFCTDTKPPTCCTYGLCANDGEPYCDYTPPSDPADPQFMRREHKRFARAPLLASVSP